MSLVAGQDTLSRGWRGDGQGREGHRRRRRKGAITSRRERATKGPKTCHRQPWKLMSGGDVDEQTSEGGGGGGVGEAG